MGGWGGGGEGYTEQGIPDDRKKVPTAAAVANRQSRPPTDCNQPLLPPPRNLKEDAVATNHRCLHQRKEDAGFDLKVSFAYLKPYPGGGPAEMRHGCSVMTMTLRNVRRSDTVGAVKDRITQLMDWSTSGELGRPDYGDYYGVWQDNHTLGDYGVNAEETLIFVRSISQMHLAILR